MNIYCQLKLNNSILSGKFDPIKAEKEEIRSDVI